MTQIILATSKYIRISPTKIDRIIKQIRGKTYKEALQILKYLPQKSGAIVWQTLYSAISNATNNFNFEKENLMIALAFVNKGPGGRQTKRVRFINKGRQAPIEKKVSHITIGVSKIEIQKL
jgi:large subunit ribosomal protein L22